MKDNSWIETLLIEKFEPTCDKDCHELHFHDDVRKAVQAIEAELVRIKDGEQNTLFAVMRHLGIEHDAKAIMRVRNQWKRQAQEQHERAGINLKGDKS